MNKRKNSKVGNKKIKVLLVSLTIIGIILLISGGYIWSKLSSIKKKDINATVPDSNKQVQEKYKKDKVDVYNIALFGLDSRLVSGKDDPRSDSIMILSIDKTRKKIKLSSIIRDSYVEIPGRDGKDKINHAYHFGGPELAVNTINHNFGLAIEDYAAINFYGLRKVIDAIGGLDIEITKDELKNLNEHIKDSAKHEGIGPTYVYDTGMQHLNGLQSTAYCRIRKAEGGDYKRAERQRDVLSKMLKKISSLGKVKMVSLANELFPCIETSLSSSEILNLGLDVIKMDLSKIDQQQFPTSWQGKGEAIGKIDYFVSDLDEVKKSMVKYIYEDKKPQNTNNKEK